MNKISVLDCTLRDGGYCNKWKFGKNNISSIIKGLVAANVDYIECGFLTNKVEYDEDVTKYSNLQQVMKFIPETEMSKPYLVMINYGEYNAEDLPDARETGIDGIRVAFHKKDWIAALEFCKSVKGKGYKVFVQPMVSTSYTEDEFTTLIHEVNLLEPYAFYIVDSFGMMKRKALMQLLEIVERNLIDNVVLGFHAHNNLQLAFSNAQYLVDVPMVRNLIIDISIHGMGRGAGNLNAELFLDYLNETINSNYVIRSILSLIDEIISRFYEENPWGYSLPNYLSALHMIHPNYATYLNEKKTLTLDAIDEIFAMIDPDKGVEFDPKYIEELYVKFLSKGKIRLEHLREISEKLSGKKVLLIAPGRSVLNERRKIEQFVEKYNPVVLSVNHDYPYVKSDYIFVSNIRRFRQLSSKVYDKTITTSNIRSENTYATVEYYQLLNMVDGVRDNAGLMAIRFLAGLNVKEFYLAGFDGYSHDIYGNYETRDMALTSSTEFLDRMTDGMRRVMDEFSKNYKINFLTDSLIVPK